MIAKARKKSKYDFEPSNRVQFVKLDRLRVSPENDLLYRQRTRNDKDFDRLCRSVSKKGIEAPLIVSRDRFIISGHQRQAAAYECGLERVPVLVKDIRRSDHTKAEWLVILREHNAGREKNCVEQIRERMIDVDPDDAHRRVVQDKLVRLRPSMEIIDLGNRVATVRSAISEAKRPMAEAIKRILIALKSYLPVSVRKVHYKLLEELVLRNASDSRSLYINNRACSSDASDMITRMRLSGEIPFNWIEDPTRTETVWKCWNCAADFIAAEQENILSGFARDLMQSQCQHFEIIVEKLTIQNFIQPTAGRYTIPVNVIRGNSSIPPRYKISQRYKKSDKESMMLICLGDCDPSGDNIVESTILSLRDEFGCEGVRGVRVALTHHQADALKLPQDMEANTDDANFARFARKHGRTDAYELDAIEPEILQKWTDEAIRAVIDVQAYNAEVRAQAQDVSEIEARAAAILELMKGI